jgi:hypothetical protein
MINDRQLHQLIVVYFVALTTHAVENDDCYHRHRHRLHGQDPPPSTAVKHHYSLQTLNTEAKCRPPQAAVTTSI